MLHYLSWERQRTAATIVNMFSFIYFNKDLLENSLERNNFR